MTVTHFRSRDAQETGGRPTLPFLSPSPYLRRPFVPLLSLILFSFPRQVNAEFLPPHGRVPLWVPLPHGAPFHFEVATEFVS